MNQMAEDAITEMLNFFPQTSQNYDVFLETLGRLCASIPGQAVIEAATRFEAGDVHGQSMTFAPSGPEFIAEVRRRQEFIELRARPRLPAPVSPPSWGMPPFMLRQQKLLNENAHLPVLFENINHDQARRMSATGAFPVGAKWVAALGIVYGPEPKPQEQVEADEHEEAA